MFFGLNVKTFYSFRLRYQRNLYSKFRNRHRKIIVKSLMVKGYCILLKTYIELCEIEGI